MEIIRTVAHLRERLKNESEVACVPTMGHIHNGHLSLVKIAKENSSLSVTTIFVNPLQFGRNEDFIGYPRTFREDCLKLESAKNDIVFAPDENEMYNQPQSFFVMPPKIANKLEGRFRRDHFRGVCTVVLKLFNIVQPQIAVFGKKDYQQLAIVRYMVNQFLLPINIVAGDTIRADDGLALSSRNHYLNSSERREAPRLSAEMGKIKEAIVSGERNFVAMEYAAGESLTRHGWHVDYVVVRTQENLLRPNSSAKNLVILGAATLGETRLIDEMEVSAP